MTRRASAPILKSRRNRQLAAVAAVAVLAAAWGGNGMAAGPFDTTDPEYTARAAKAVADDKIRKECLPSSAPQHEAAYTPIAAPTDALVEAASKEGRLVINSGISDKTTVTAYQAAFELRYPKIRLTVVTGASQAFEERLLADNAAGNQPVDIAITNKRAWADRAFKEKALDPIDKTIPGFFDKWPQGSWRWDLANGKAAPGFYRSLGIAYNSDLVKGDLIPKDFKDLANPKFKGQLLGMDPEFSATFALTWKHIMDVVDEATMKAIGNNLIKKPLYTDVQPAAQALGAGAGMVLMQMGANVAATMQGDGAPVQGVMPQTTTGTQYSVLAVTKAPHPNAAKLFLHWLYAAEGQWVFSCSAFAGTVAYSGFGSKNFVPIESVSKEEVARIKSLLGL